LKKKGYYIKKERKNEIVLNLFVEDFKAYLDQLETVKGWVRFRVYEREKPATNGLTHNMEHIISNNTENK
jgi:hypothetical protein